MLRLNPTRLRRFFRCERDWYAYVVERVEPRAPRDGLGRTRGKVMHALLEYALKHYARTGAVFDFSGAVGYAAAEQIYEQLFQDEGLALGEELSHELLAAVRYHIPRLNLEKWEVLEINGEPAVELCLRAPLLEGVELEAIIDVVFRHKETGQIWLVDWKTTYYPIDTATLTPYCERDYQLAIGRTILAYHDVRVDMSAKVYLRSAPPKPPELTARTKKVTRNKSKLACDWPTYRKAIIANGEDPNAPDVLAVHDHLQTATFARWRIDITSEQTEAHLHAAICRAAARMRDLHQGAEPLLNLRDPDSAVFKGCGACDYFKWCAAALRTPTGGPDLSLLRTDYRAKTGSPLQASAELPAPFDPSAAYVRFAAERGQTLEPTQEFRP